LDRLVAVNESRIDFREKFESLIAEYNAGSMAIERVFEELVRVGQSLSEEQRRHVRENLRADELAVFDLLTRPGPDLSRAERDAVKKVARQLMERVRVVLTPDWPKTVHTRARVQERIEEVLDEGLPRTYTPDVFRTKVG